MIKLIIVDDEVLIREGLKILMSVYDDIEVVGDFPDGEDAYRFCSANEVDVALMDIRMERCSGVQATRIIKEENKSVKVIILTTFKDTEYITKAISYGASGYLLKDSSSDKIYEAIKSVNSGNVVVTPEIAKEMLSEVPKEKEIEEPREVVLKKVMNEHGLSEKEINIIGCIAEGMTNKEISEELFLAQGTIKNNISNILSKLYLRDRTQLAIFAFKNGISS